MFVWTARIPKKRILLLAAAALAAAALLLFLFWGMKSSGEKISRLETNEDRTAYLQSLGWEVSPEPVETLQLLLPDPLPQEYRTYNELQKKSGFDLSACCGKELSRYTYLVTNYPGRPQGVQLNLYLCGGVAVAGDVVASGEKGFRAGLAFPGDKEKDVLQS